MNNFLLKDCIKIIKNAIPYEICDEIILSADKMQWEKHNWYDKKSDSHFSNKDKELDVCFLEKNFANLLFEYIISNFGNYHNIFVEGNYNNSFLNMIHNCSSPRLNRYLPDTEMKGHFDHIHSLFDGNQKGIPILSLIGVLNDDYTGGELVFFDNHVLQLNKGDIVIFPSCFLFPHRVNEIKKGTRYSFVSWAW